MREISTKRVIVVVDDDETQAHLLEEFLLDNNFEVHVAFTGMEGLRIIHEHHPDLVILDLVLPDIRGSDLCSQLRANKNTQSIPIILCTAHQISPTEKVKGFRSGADDYVVRPFELAELLARVEAVLRRSKLQTKPDTLAGIESILNKPAAVVSVPIAPGPAPTIALQPAGVPGVSTAPKRHPTFPNIFLQVWWFLNDPVARFKALSEREDFLISNMFVIGTPVIASVEKLFHSSGGFDAWIGFFSLGIVVHLVLWFVTASLLHLVMPFEGVSMPMKRALTFAGFCWAPHLIEATLGLLYGLISAVGLAGEPVRFSAGVDMIPGWPASGFLSTIARVSLFDFWAAGLMLLAVWTLSRSQASRFNWTTILIGASCLLIGVLSHF